MLWKHEVQQAALSASCISAVYVIHCMANIEILVPCIVAGDMTIMKNYQSTVISLSLNSGTPINVIHKAF